MLTVLYRDTQQCVTGAYFMFVVLCVDSVPALEMSLTVLCVMCPPEQIKASYLRAQTEIHIWNTGTAVETGRKTNFKMHPHTYWSVTEH